MLDQQLRKLGVFEITDSVMHESNVYTLLKNAWADNADALSLQYAGQDPFHSLLF